MPTTETGPVLDRLISINDAAERYRTSKSWLYKRVEAKEIPAYRLSGKLFFDPEETDELILSRGRVERIEG